MTFDAAALRAEFPALRGGELVYLDNAASTLVPRGVIDAVTDYYASSGANVHRAVHPLSDAATRAFEGARRDVARLLGAPDAKEVVFTGGTTDALNLVARGWAQPRLARGDEVLVTKLEHHSNLVPWQMVCAATGATLVAAPVAGDGSVELEAIASRIGARTRVVALAHVSNATGALLPVREVAAAARAVGALCVVDGAQSLPHLAVDVAELGCDFYAYSGHKAYGPSGIGALWGRPERLAEVEPWRGGGEMIDRVELTTSTWAAPPARLEAGTPNVAGAIGLGAAARFLLGIDREEAAAHERALREAAAARLDALPGIRVVANGPGRVAVVPFVSDRDSPHELAGVLGASGICVRSGDHCAQPLHARLGLAGTARASFGIYNDADDVDRLVETLASLAAD